MGIERLLGIRAKGTDGIPVKNLIAATAETHDELDKRGASAVLLAWVTEESKIAPEERSLFDIVNSVTRAGQSMDNKSWVDYDKLGGKLMNYNDRQWNQLKSRAESYDDKDLSSTFAKTVLSA